MITSGHQVTEADKEDARAILLALMRTPKTRAGLVAAVAGLVGRRHVYGWLGDWVRWGVVVKQKSSIRALYMLPTAVPQIAVKPSIYPAWLDPRHLYEASSRRVYIAARLVGDKVGTTSNKGDDYDDEEDFEADRSKGEEDRQVLQPPTLCGPAKRGQL